MSLTPTAFSAISGKIDCVNIDVIMENLFFLFRMKSFLLQFFFRKKLFFTLFLPIKIQHCCFIHCCLILKKMLIFVYAALWNANRIRSAMKNMLFTKMLSPNGLNANKSSAHLRNKVVPSQVVLSRLNILKWNVYETGTRDASKPIL